MQRQFQDIMALVAGGLVQHFIRIFSFVLAAILVLPGCSKEPEPAQRSSAAPRKQADAAEKREDRVVVGLVNSGAHPILDVIVAAFNARLVELGYTDVGINDPRTRAAYLNFSGTGCPPAESAHTSGALRRAGGR